MSLKFRLGRGRRSSLRPSVRAPDSCMLRCISQVGQHLKCPLSFHPGSHAYRASRQSRCEAYE